MSEYTIRVTPYETIGNTIEAWCEKHGYQTMLVSISLYYNGEKPREITEIFEFDGDNFGFVWASDWWEGEQNVELLGFSPLDSLHLRGFPADVRPVVLCRDCMMRQYCKVAQYLGADGFCSNGEKREDKKGER